MQIKPNSNNNMQIFVFSIVFLLTVIAWVAVEVYHIEKNKKFTVAYQAGMTMNVELLPNLDILKRLQQKK